MAQASQQQLSRMGVSTVISYLFLILIVIFSGLIVKYMADDIIRTQIESTLGLRLLLHSIGLSYNAMYSLPTGRTIMKLTVPDSCSVKCIDCNSTIEFTPLPTRVVTCSCNDGLNKDSLLNDANLLGDTLPDQYGLVCNDYIVSELKPVMLFFGGKPVSMAIRAKLRIYPKSELFWSFKDFLSSYINEAFFNREITVFSEVPVNLNDYLVVRRLLQPGVSNDIINPLLTSLKNTPSVGLRRITYDGFDSVVDSDKYFGLDGLVRLIRDGGGELILKPGQRIVSDDGLIVCEEECYSVNSLGGDCVSGWNRVGCFDLSKLGVTSITLCGSDECDGATTFNPDKLIYFDVMTGVKGELTNVTLTNNWIDWSLSNDCSIRAVMGDDYFNVSVKSKPCEDKCDSSGWTLIGANFCQLGYQVFGTAFCGCDAEGNYTYPLNYGPIEEVLRIHDRPSLFYLKALLVSNDVSVYYNVIPYDDKVVLEPVDNTSYSSKYGIDNGEAFSDVVMTVSVLDDGGVIVNGG